MNHPLFAALLLLASTPAIAQSDFCSNSAPGLPLNTTVNFSTFAAGSEIQQTCGAGDALDVWFRFIAPSINTFRFTVSSDVLDPTVALFGSCGGSALACNDDASAATADAEVSHFMISGQTVLVRIAANFFDEGPFTILVTSQPPPVAGACCFGSTCLILVQADCIPSATAGARFAGASVPCNPAGNTTSPCCRADFNQTGGVTVQDLFDFLDRWFAAAPEADIDRVNGVGVQDLFDYLNLWFAGC